ncbi:glycoside hydrolase family 17 protein [Myriangium duriaei CBS 260.36]|uniref:glucan endo-1,3-beta-D-glucosidase n=1 Tax=Myriangium duriaei CBS 260.36 TaxID=1168546 RepID=A0A9P4MJN7_9PEZI|nr:glycoside hydrolase family 17 protein [Myriangium duriaei CBS 260.36]
MREVSSAAAYNAYGGGGGKLGHETPRRQHELSHARNHHHPLPPHHGTATTPTGSTTHARTLVQHDHYFSPPSSPERALLSSHSALTSQSSSPTRSVNYSSPSVATAPAASTANIRSTATEPHRYQRQLHSAKDSPNRYQANRTAPVPSVAACLISPPEYSPNMAGQIFRNDFNDIPSPPTHRHFDMENPFNRSGSEVQHNGPYDTDGYHHYNVPQTDDHQSLRDNHFNRHSFYDTGAYPEISPSPARLSRPEFDHINPESIADEEELAYSHPQRDSPGRNRFSKLPTVMGGSGAAVTYSSVGQGGSSQMLAAPADAIHEKAAWKDMDDLDRRKRKRYLWILVAVIAVLAIAGGVVGGILGTRKSNSDKSTSNGSSSSPGSSSGSAHGGDAGLNTNSAQIKALMNNPDLHKVFPVMDYTPYNTQFPACLDSPPSQDNVTMDMAVLSQLTPAIRFYGTDCNQTQMALTAIDRLGLNSTMKVWLGVWIDTNTTTNDRQLAQMYDILKVYPADHFSGVIVGNEVLFRKDQTEAHMVQLLSDVRTNLTNMGIKLSVSTSDLGSSWNTTLADASDHVMGNIHPFFAGVPAPGAASWTWSFWQNFDVSVAPESSKSAATGNIPRNIISETGWPSAGGNDCGTEDACTSATVGSVAGITEMNQFMDDWICQANANGTMYFWFEAFDEPWKVKFNTQNEQWEDKWGLMGIDRKLKSGVTIPNCGGKTLG